VIITHNFFETASRENKEKSKHRQKKCKRVEDLSLRLLIGNILDLDIWENL
jgi:hypothetical protein